MPTTGGALAFADLVPPVRSDAHEESRGRRARSFSPRRSSPSSRTGSPSGMPGNYNGLNGYGMNPWDPRRDPRDAFFDGRPVLTTGGSSSRRRDQRELLDGERRHRNVGLDPQPVEPEHARRHQADGRAREPLRRHPDHGGPGHAGTDGAHRVRRGDLARRTGRRVAGPERPGDAQVPAAGRPRLYEIPQPRRVSRARASAFRARSSTSSTSAGATRRAAG